jgi:hypothetical protein
VAVVTEEAVVAEDSEVEEAEAEEREALLQSVDSIAIFVVTRTP